MKNKVIAMPKSGTRGACPVCGIKLFLDSVGACFACTERYSRIKGRRRLRVVDEQFKHNYRHYVLGFGEPSEAVHELDRHLLDS